MDPLKAINDSEGNLGQSATSYQAVDISAADWTPARPFKGLHIGAAGNVVIKGIDGVNSPAMPVTPGVLPYGGLAVIRTNTTATITAALF
jgi:hypothetical protein